MQTYDITPASGLERHMDGMDLVAFAGRVGDIGSVRRPAQQADTVAVSRREVVELLDCAEWALREDSARQGSVPTVFYGRLRGMLFVALSVGAISAEEHDRRQVAADELYLARGR